MCTAPPAQFVSLLLTSLCQGEFPPSLGLSLMNSPWVFCLCHGCVSTFLLSIHYHIISSFQGKSKAVTVLCQCPLHSGSKPPLPLRCKEVLCTVVVFWYHWAGNCVKNIRSKSLSMSCCQSLENLLWPVSISDVRKSRSVCISVHMTPPYPHKLH